MSALKYCCLAVIFIACRVINTKRTILFLSRLVNAYCPLFVLQRIPAKMHRTFFKTSLFQIKLIHIGHKQFGFSMIELLVAMLVFSIGLLGMASLQITGIRMTHDAELMARASLYATSMADQIRAKPSTVVDSSEWNRNIQIDLPQGHGEVRTVNHVHTISVSWTASQDSSDHNNERSYELVVHL